MWHFIISGYVPGTDFQITFEMIELFVLFILGGAILYSLLKQLAYFYLFALRVQHASSEEKTA